VDHSQDLPILRYIRQNVRYFSGRLGNYRLKKRASEGRILLLLDGYDEIAMDVSHKIRVELNRLFSNKRPPFVPLYDARSIITLSKNEGLSILDQLRRNHVWLTSRRDFYNAHYLDVVYSDSYTSGRTYDRSVSLFQLEGVGLKREALVQKVFARYANRELLNVDRFLEYIDRAEGAEVQHLSNNPLFLTVMCYVYAKEVLYLGAKNMDELGSFDEIIERCVELLIRDKDESKARDLPEAQRKALLSRRNEHSEEKMLFLKYLAGRLFLDNVGLFSVEYLREVALKWFSEGEFSPKVRDELQSSMGRDEDSIVTQLIYGGIFVEQRVERTGGMFDFPHRRFREVLAWRYYQAQPATLLDNVGNASWHELVLFVFSRGTHPDLIFRALLDLVVREPEQYSHGRLAGRCLENVPHLSDKIAEQLRIELDDFFEQRLVDGRPFKLPESMVKYVAETRSWVELMTGRLRRTLDDFDLDLRLLCEIIAIVDRNKLKELLEDFWTHGRLPVNKQDLAILLRFTFSYNPSAIRHRVARLQNDPEVADWLGHCLIRYSPTRDPDFAADLLQGLSSAAAEAFMLRIERDDFDGLYRTLSAERNPFTLFAEQERRWRSQSGEQRSNEALALPDLVHTPFLQTLFVTEAV
jgi:hypothetical protein